MLARNSLLGLTLLVVAAGCGSKEQAAVDRINQAAQNAAHYRVVNLTDLALTSKAGPATLTVFSADDGNAAYSRVRPRKQELAIEGGETPYKTEYEFKAKTAYTAYCLPDGKGFKVVMVEGSADRPEKEASRLQVVNLTDAAVSLSAPKAAELAGGKAEGGIDLKVGSTEIVAGAMKATVNAEGGAGYTAIITDTGIKIVTDHPKMNIEAGGSSTAG